MAPKSNIKITVNCVADSYRSTPDAKTIEFSGTREDVLEDGSYITLMGGLIDFRIQRASSGVVPEDMLIVTVRRTDANVRVVWAQPEDSTPLVPVTQPAGPADPELISAARSWAADCEWAEGADDIADLTDAQIVAGVDAHYDGGWAAFVQDGGAR